MKKKSKIMNSENGENPEKNKDKEISSDGKSDYVDLDWIFDKGWLRTKK